MENRWPRNGSIPSRNKKEEAMFLTDRRTDRQNQRQEIIDSYSYMYNVMQSSDIVTTTLRNSFCRTG